MRTRRLRKVLDEMPKRGTQRKGSRFEQNPLCKYLQKEKLKIQELGKKCDSRLILIESNKVCEKKERNNQSHYLNGSNG